MAGSVFAKPAQIRHREKVRERRSGWWVAGGLLIVVAIVLPLLKLQEQV